MSKLNLVSCRYSNRKPFSLEFQSVERVRERARARERERERDGVEDSDAGSRLESSCMLFTLRNMLP